MQVGWGPKVATASMVPNVTIMLLNAIFGHHFRTRTCLLVSLSLVIVLFIFTSAMCLVESDGWQDTFLYVTVASVVVININAAIFQSKQSPTTTNKPNPLFIPEFVSRDLLLTFAKFK